MSKKTGFLVGALVGAAAALFLAPKKGSELREGAGKIYDDLKENPQETLTGMRDTALDFSAEKFNDIKEKFDSGEISADKAKEFLLSKRDLIMEKVDSGELSKDSVVDFFNDTKDAVVEKINSMKDSGEELFDENESDISEEAAEVVAKFRDAKDEVKEDIDTESLAEEALKEAIVLAKRDNSQLFVLHATDKNSIYAAGNPVPVVPAPAIPVVPAVPVLEESADNEAKEVLDKALAIINNEVKFEEIRVDGSAKNEIVDFAKEHEIDMIVMGSSGKGALDRMLLGSTAVYVVKHAPCSVTIIK